MIHKSFKSGFFKLKCGTCDNFYLGRIFRNFKTGGFIQNILKVLSIKHDPNYLNLTNHNFDSDFSISHTKRTELKLIIWVALESYKFKKSNNLFELLIVFSNYLDFLADLEIMNQHNFNEPISILRFGVMSFYSV